MAITKALMAAISSSDAGTGTGLFRKARAAATRVGYLGPSRYQLLVDGVSRTRNFDAETWSIIERDAGQSNELRIEMFGFTPEAGQVVTLGHGTIRNRLFVGPIVRASKVHRRLNEGRIIWACTVLDWNYDLAASASVSKKYTNLSGTAIAIDLMEEFAGAGTLTAPVSSPAATAANGAGLTAAGAYKWKVSFVAGSVESLAGPDSGTHNVPSAAAIDDPTTTPTAVAADGSNGLTVAGVYKWKVTFVTATGETLPGPETVSPYTVPAPVGVPTPGAGDASNVRNHSSADPNGGPTNGATYSYKITWYHGVESGPGPATSNVVSNGNDILIDHTAPQPTNAVLILYRTLANGSTYYLVSANAPDLVGTRFSAGTIRDYANDSLLNQAFQPPAPPASTDQEWVTLSGIPVSTQPNVTSRKLYRTVAGGGTFKLVTTIADNVSTTYVDSLPDGSLGANAPGSNTAGTQVRAQVALSSIPVSGSANVTARRIYRTLPSGSVFKLVGAIANNTATTFLDSVADGSLGEDEPAAGEPLFSTGHVQADLPVIDEIQFTMQSVASALQQLADRLGAYWYLDFDKSLHFFTEESGTAPVPITTSNRYTRSVTHEVDIETLKNRVWVEGDGSDLVAAVAIGGTSIPVADATQFAAGGTNYAKLEAQLITYTGKSLLEGGCVTGGLTGIAPSAPSAAFDVTAGNLSPGAYQYKTSFVSGAGETELSAASAPVSLAEVPPPANNQMSLFSLNAGGAVPGDEVYGYRVSFVTVAGETTANQDRTISVFAPHDAVVISNIPISTDPRVTARRLYRNASTGGSVSGPFYLLTTINNNVDTDYVDVSADGALGALAPPANTTAATGRMSVSSIAIGPTGTTSRKVYRTVANGTVFKLLTTIANNTGTTYADNTADGSLGADATGATIGAAPGDTTLRVTDLAKFPAAGWVRVGSQVIQYTGRSAATDAGTLTGIPASGPGAIVSEIPASSMVLVQPHLTGVAASGRYSVRHALRVGESVNILVLWQDETSQITNQRVREHYIQDRRLNLAGCAERGIAAGALLKDPRVTGTVVSTDPKLRGGAPLTITMAAWSIDAVVTVRSVAVTPSKLAHPVRSAMFSSRTIDDLFSELRAIREQLAR